MKHWCWWLPWSVLLGFRLVLVLTSRKINQVQFAVGEDTQFVFGQTFLDIDSEHWVGTWRDCVHLSLSHLAMGDASEQQFKEVTNSIYSLFSQKFNCNTFLLVFYYLKWSTIFSRAEQILDLFIVNFQKWTFQFEFHFPFVSLNLYFFGFHQLTQVLEHSGSYPSTFLILRISKHGVFFREQSLNCICFACTCLAVCKNRCIVTFNAIFTNASSNRVKDLLITALTS